MANQAMSARAYVLGSRLDTKELERSETLARTPLVVRTGKGYAVLFRFGVAVFIDVEAVDEAAFMKSLEPFVSEAVSELEYEKAELLVDPSREERIDATGMIVLKEASLERLQLVAQVLAKSAILSYYEVRVSKVFDRVEQLATQFSRGTIPVRRKALLREIGDTLLIQARTVGRVEVTEKPELVWDSPELDRLYERLASEYELRDRDVALSRKLELISNTAETYLDLLNNRNSLRVEWYIVVLIVVELVLTLYEQFVVR